MIAISVIIPVYNMEKYLDECLDSVTKQTLTNIEILCINDGSLDSSLKILQKWQKKDNRIIIINQENQGVAIARNNGIHSAKSEYVCFMDPDDYYPDEKVLEDLYHAAKKSRALICGGSFSRYDARTKKITDVFTGIYEKYTFPREEMISYESYQYDYGYHRFIYSLPMLNEHQIYFPLYKRFQDPPFFVKAMLTAKDFYAIDRVVYRYRIGHQTVKWNNEKLVHFLNGILDNLKMSADFELCDLHAATVYRILEQQRVIKTYAFETTECQKCLFNAFLNIRKDLLDKSAYDIDYVALSELLMGNFSNNKNYAILQKQYDNLRNSTTFKIARKLMVVPGIIKKYCNLLNSRGL